MMKKSLAIFVTGLFLGIATPYLFKIFSSHPSAGYRDLEMKINFNLAEHMHSTGELMMWKTVIAPMEKNTPGIALHRHTDARILIPLTEGTLQRLEPNGHTENYELKIGKPLFLAKDTDTGYHTDENLGDKPIEVIVLQFKGLTDITTAPLTEKDVQTVLIKP